LLFVAIARRRWEQAGRELSDWPLVLFDKRAHYTRTHRLRLDPRPYRALIAQAEDPRFDQVGRFLEAEDFRPNIQDLERELAALAEGFGVEKRITAVAEPGGLALSELRAAVMGDRGGRFTIVGADSVHSRIREAIGGVGGRRVTHETLARFVMTGEAVPRQLSVLQTYRVSKVVASIFEYRCRESGRAEIDLFVTRAAHDALQALGPTPAAPVLLTEARIRGLEDPLLRRFLHLLGGGFGQGACAVAVQSVFRLEHAIAARRAQVSTSLDDTTVFLVGDAAASLPFQRGMACLAKCASALADAHLDLSDPDRAAAQYDAEVARIVAEELVVVGARARLVAGLRAFVRISALLPFPIQTWLLAEPTAVPPGRLTPGLALNGLVASAMCIVSLGAPVFGWLGGLAPALGILLGGAGGVVYRATLTFEPVPNGWVQVLWRWTLVLVLVGGVALTLASSAVDGAPRHIGLLVLWWTEGIAFALGIGFFEWVGHRGFALGRLNQLESDPPDRA